MRGGRIFEYWAHEACLVPIEDYPMPPLAHGATPPSRTHGAAMSSSREPEVYPRSRCSREIAERGPLGSRHFEGSVPGGMWNWKTAKIGARGALHSSGRLPISGRDGFQRLYDLPDP